MKKHLLQVAVYPLLLANLALGYLMYMMTYQDIMLLVDLLRDTDAFSRQMLGPFKYVRSTISSLGAIVLGLLALIAFPLLQSFYTSGAQAAKELGRRFLRVTGFQIAYVGMLLLAFRIMVSQAVGLGWNPVVPVLVTGLGCAMALGTRRRTEQVDLHIHLDGG